MNMTTPPHKVATPMWSDMVRLVDEHRVYECKLSHLVKLVGAGSVGPQVVGEIASRLRESGIGWLPRELPAEGVRASKVPVVLYRDGGRVGTLMRAIDGEVTSELVRILRELEAGSEEITRMGKNLSDLQTVLKEVTDKFGSTEE